MAELFAAFVSAGLLAVRVAVAETSAGPSGRSNATQVVSLLVAPTASGPNVQVSLSVVVSSGQCGPCPWP